MSQLEDEFGADWERRRGELVQLCEGSEGSILPRLSHTHCGRGLFYTHNEAKMPGVGAEATGSGFSLSEPVLHPCLGLRLSPWSRCSERLAAIIIIIIISALDI